MQELIQNILATVDKKGVQRDGKKILKKMQHEIRKGYGLCHRTGGLTVCLRA